MNGHDLGIYLQLRSLSSLLPHWIEFGSTTAILVEEHAVLEMRPLVYWPY